MMGLEFWDRVKKARTKWWRSKGVWFRVVARLYMAGVIIAACSLAYSWRLDWLASVTKTWPTSRILNDATIEVETKCSESVLSYVVAIVPLLGDAALTHVEKTNRGMFITDWIRQHLKVIHLQFVDRDGSPTAAYDVAIDEFVRIYSSSDERPTRLEARGMLACNPANYVLAETLKLNLVER